MDTTATAAPVTVADPADASTDRCQMCRHRTADHDPLAQRYCNATAQGALSRGCICR